jgi:hypothetical protein
MVWPPDMTSKPGGTYRDPVRVPDRTPPLARRVVAKDERDFHGLDQLLFLAEPAGENDLVVTLFDFLGHLEDGDRHDDLFTGSQLTDMRLDAGHARGTSPPRNSLRPSRHFPQEPVPYLLELGRRVRVRRLADCVDGHAQRRCPQLSGSAPEQLAVVGFEQLGNASPVPVEVILGDKNNRGLCGQT